MIRTVGLVLASLLLGVVSAFTPHEGAEVLIVDPGGQNILGHGVISDGRLLLSLSPDTRSFKILLVHPDGTVEMYDGRREGLHQLEIEIEPGMHVRLSDLMADANIRVDVSVAERLSPPRAGDDASERDDDRGSDASGPPERGPRDGLPLPATPVTPPRASPVTPPPIGLPTDEDDDDEADDEDDDANETETDDDDADERDAGDDSDGLVPSPIGPIGPIDTEDVDDTDDLGVPDVDVRN